MIIFSMSDRGQEKFVINQISKWRGAKEGEEFHMLITNNNVHPRLLVKVPPTSPPGVLMIIKSTSTSEYTEVVRSGDIKQI